MISSEKLNIKEEAKTKRDTIKSMQNIEIYNSVGAKFIMPVKEQRGINKQIE
jgi:hypothetical protein